VRCSAITFRSNGIATFTDLANAIALEYADIDCFVLAMNDAGRHHAYPRVRFEIAGTTSRGAGAP
jgi:hypothetical protein